MKEKVIITGVNGFIGKALAELFIQEGFDVIGIDIYPVSMIHEITYYQKNLKKDDIKSILKKIVPHYFIHCAGVANVNDSVIYPERDLIDNVFMTQKVLYQILDSNVECCFVYLSSAAVYGQARKLPIHENSNLEPISPYALHKQMAENLCTYFRKQHKMNIKILRIFSAYGPGLKKQLFWDMGKKISQFNKLELFGTGAESRDFIYITDLARAILCVVMHYDSSIINIASGIETTIKQAATIFTKKWGSSNDIICFNQVSRIGNPVNWKADITRLNKLGFTCSVSLETGIEKYVNWFKEVNNGK